MPIEKIKKLNRDSEKEYRAIVHEPIKTATTVCEELIYYKGSWIMPGDGIARRFLDATKK